MVSDPCERFNILSAEVVLPVADKREHRLQSFGCFLRWIQNWGMTRPGRAGTSAGAGIARAGRYPETPTVKR